MGDNVQILVCMNVKDKFSHVDDSFRVIIVVSGGAFQLGWWQKSSHFAISQRNDLIEILTSQDFFCKVITGKGLKILATL